LLGDLVIRLRFFRSERMRRSRRTPRGRTAMTGHTITSTVARTTGVAADSAPRRPSLALSRAAQELDLRRGEFDLAVQLGCVRTVPDEGGGGRRVTRAEIDRVRSEDGFLEALRERVK